jgi:hypothetical protein
MGCCISSSTAVETLSVVNNKNKNEAPPSKPKTSRAKSMPSRGSVQLSSPEELFPSAGTSSTAIKQIKFNQKNLLSVDIPGSRRLDVFFLDQSFGVDLILTLCSNAQAIARCSVAVPPHYRPCLIPQITHRITNRLHI